MDWPNDADGGVMRRLQRSGFPFDCEAVIDFNVEFDEPPDELVVRMLKGELPSAKISEQNDEILVQVRALITYPFVVRMQADLSRMCARFGGRCESWGVFWQSER
jgi:hypothetical protein